MAKKLKIEGIDAVGILNSIRPVSEPLKEIPRVENTTETSESNNRRNVLAKRQRRRHWNNTARPSYRFPRLMTANPYL